MSCIFCKIINKEADSEIIYEDSQLVAFKDIHPKASFHLLLAPKKHISSIAEIKDSDKELIGELVLRAKKIAEENSISGYKLVINVGREGGQIVEHLHLHLLGGLVKAMP